MFRIARSLVAAVAASALTLGTLGCGGSSRGGGSTPTTTLGSVDGYVYAPRGTRAGGGDTGISLGRQVPSNADPVSGALVTVVDTVLTATTDAGGFFRIDNVPEGERVLRVTKTGFNTSEATVTVTSGQVTRVNDTGGGGILLTTGDRAKWTFMVYMNADNDLEEFALQDLNEMERIGSTSEVNIVVEVDRSRGYDSSNGDWTDGRRYYITKDTDTQIVGSQILAQLGEIDMGDPARLKSFVEWAMVEYPAEYYLLDMWNHGAGFRSRGGGRDPISRGFSFDDTQNTNIKTTALPDAIRGPDKLDILAWDSSLMQMMEIADQVGDAATFMVGSEESPPGDGYPYHTFLEDLIANPSLAPEQFATLIVNDTIDALGNQFDVTQSALRLSHLPTLRTALSAFAEQLTGAMGLYASEIAAARRDAQEYGHGASTFRDYKDIQDFAERIKTNVPSQTVQASADGVIQALSAALVAENHSGSSVSNSHGLSIYIPPRNDYLSSYDDLHFAKNTKWDEFINAQTQ